MSWGDRVNELLYDGETVRETVDVGANRVFVTSHRVLAFFEDGPGANFRQVDRPNVAGATAGSESDRGALARAVGLALAGVAFLVGGIAFEVGSLVSVPEGLQGGAIGGTSGLISLFETFVETLALVDEAVAVLGLGVLALAGFYGWRYQTSREHVVTVGVAGEADLELVVDAGGETYARELRRAFEDVRPPQTVEDT